MWIHRLYHHDIRTSVFIMTLEVLAFQLVAPGLGHDGVYEEGDPGTGWDTA